MLGNAPDAKAHVWKTGWARDFANDAVKDGLKTGLLFRHLIGERSKRGKPSPIKSNSPF